MFGTNRKWPHLLGHSVISPSTINHDHLTRLLTIMALLLLARVGLFSVDFPSLYAYSSYHVTLCRPLKRLQLMVPATRLTNIMRFVLELLVLYEFFCCCFMSFSFGLIFYVASSFFFFFLKKGFINALGRNRFHWIFYRIYSVSCNSWFVMLCSSPPFRLWVLLAIGNSTNLILSSPELIRDL